MNDNRGGVKLKSTLKTLPVSAIWVLFKCSLSAFMISFLLQYDPYVYKHCTCQTKQCLQTFLPSRLAPTRLQLLDLENISFLKRTLLGWWSHCRTHISLLNQSKFQCSYFFQPFNLSISMVLYAHKFLTSLQRWRRLFSQFCHQTRVRGVGAAWLWAGAVPTER